MYSANPLGWRGRPRWPSVVVIYGRFDMALPIATDPDVGLILPGTLAYSIALTEIPPVPTWRAEAERTNGETYLICRPGSQGLMETVTYKEWIDYVYGGELDERQDEIDALDEELEGVIIA